MKLNSKLTGGLAWAGLIVVLAVPSADLLTGKESGDSVRAVTADTGTAKTADVSGSSKPAAASQAAAQDPVDAYLATGKKLPSYISDAPAEVASDKPAPVTKLVVPQTPATSVPEVPKVSVASLPAKTEVEPPIPYPASKRPAPPATQVASTSPSTIVAPATGVSSGPSATTTANEAQDEPLVIDEDLVERRDAAVARVLDEDLDPQPAGGRVVEEDMLEEWDSGSLADYLERKGLMSDGEQASASDFEDDDEFFIDDDRSEARVIRRLPRRNDFFFF